MRVPAKIGILTVATNIYLDYWQAMAESLNRLENAENFVLHVFTDDPSRAEFMSTSWNVEVQTHQIPPLKWPEATLDRYSVFSDGGDQINEDILIHLDADMIIRGDIYPRLIEASLNTGIFLVRHPGYYRKTRPNFLRQVFTTSPLGDWESNPKSQACVPKKDRKTYFCGGVWGGRRKDFLSLVSTLAQRVEEDKRNGVMAKWHDESHLNWWATKNSYSALGPEWCFVPDYPQLESIKPLIEAVEKYDARTR